MPYSNFKRRAAAHPAGYQQPQHAPFVAPTGGWVSAANLAAAPKGTAQRLENLLPTTTGLKMRRGSQKHATASAEPLESLMAYVGSSRKVFGGSDGSIFDLTSPVDPDTPPTADVSGQSSNYYSHVNFSNVGGNWMLCANGTDEMLVYDGTVFYPAYGTDLYALNFDTQTGNFTVGQTLTGGTSGHTGIIVKNIDNGTAGTLWLRATTGTFQNNETITDGVGGSALADGTRTLLLAALTGVASDKISHVNAYRNRAWLVERDTTKAYYLATDAISGAVAGNVSLAGVFKLGGSLLFTATWSLDAGDGLDDKIVFVSTEGEVAVYQGDPVDPTVWGLVGLYECSPPLGKNAWLKIAGDLLILTQIGIIPLSAIINRDPGALALAAVSRNIQPDWQAEVLSRGALPWEIVKWTSRNLAIISCPVTSDAVDLIAFAVNLETGAWAKVTGWNTRCLILHDDNVYFGTNDGTLMQADVTGADDGMPIYYLYAGQNEHLAGVGRYTTVMQARAIFRSRTPINPRIDVTTDYEINLPTYPDAPSLSSSGDLWDVGLWDVAMWDPVSEYFTVRLGWVSVGQSGFAHAPLLLLTSGSDVPPDAELVMFEVTHNPGSIIN